MAQPNSTFITCKNLQPDPNEYSFAAYIDYKQKADTYIST